MSRQIRCVSRARLETEKADLVDHEEVGLQYSSSESRSAQDCLGWRAAKPDEHDVPEKRRDRPFGESFRLRFRVFMPSQLAVTLTFRSGALTLSNVTVLGGDRQALNILQRASVDEGIKLTSRR